MTQSVVRLGKRVYFYPGHVTAGQTDEIGRIKADLKQCASTSTSDDQVNVCLKNLADRIKPYLKTGVPELNIPQADPLLIDR